MGRIIPVNIRNRIAEADDSILYICGNSDFSIIFSFDDEWAEHAVKTARFIWNGQHADVPFTGNTCPVPIISDTHSFDVGVYAGNLHTTTPAYVPCKKSILCKGGKPADPAPDVYAQLMAKIDELAKSGGVTDEKLEEIIKEYLSENPVSGVTQEELTQAVNAALQTAKDSGEFKGEPGKPGEPGEPGYTPQKGIDYFDGEPGTPGQPGAPGEAATLTITGAEILPYGSAPTVTEQTGSTAQNRLYKLGIPEGKPGADAEGGAGGESAGGAQWDLLVNQEITEDCAVAEFFNGDHGEKFNDYEELIVLVDLAPNAAQHTVKSKISFLKNDNVWFGPYGFGLVGHTLDPAEHAVIRAKRYQKTQYGIIPVQDYNQYNTASVSNNLRMGIREPNAVDGEMTLPVATKGHMTLDVTNLTVQTEFEAVRFGSYQPMVGAGTIIKVWGRRA